MKINLYFFFSHEVQQFIYFFLSVPAVAHKLHALNQGLLSRDEVINWFPVLPQLAVSAVSTLRMFCPDCGAKIRTNLRNVEIIIITVKHLHKLLKYLQNKMRDLNSGRHYSLNYQQKSRGGKECQILSFLGVTGRVLEFIPAAFGQRQGAQLIARTYSRWTFGALILCSSRTKQELPTRGMLLLASMKNCLFWLWKNCVLVQKICNVSHIAMANAHCSHQLAQ